MARLIDILDKFLDGVRADNPFGLVLKGGTALAIHHLPGHRESEDLDFDVPISFRPRNAEVENHIKGRLEKLKADDVINGFEIPKAVFASTDRFHMTVIIRTHVRYQTKIDLNYRVMPEDFEMDGQLRFYTSERMLVDKLLTFSSRGALKDFYDISLLLDKVKAGSFKEPRKIAGLVDAVVEKASGQGLTNEFKQELRATDLRFHHLKENGVESFVTRTIRNLRQFRNKLAKRT
jgi:predicted nucleotidyltransferase component of viral defense system